MEAFTEQRHQNLSKNSIVTIATYCSRSSSNGFTIWHIDALGSLLDATENICAVLDFSIMIYDKIGTPAIKYRH
jgi:hypothetical protein